MKTTTLTNTGLWSLIVLAGAVSPALADEPTFRFSRGVKTPPLKREELLAVPLDRDIFAATQEGLADLRLHDAEGKPVPYLVRKAQTTKPRMTRTAWPARQPVLRPLDDGGLEITVQLGERDPRPNALSLVSPLRNFRQRVRVYSSADGEQWEPAGDETVIFDYSRYMDVRNDTASFPDSARRWFRIVIDDVTIEQESELLALTRRLRGKDETERTEQVTVDRRPFRIERIDFRRDVQEERSVGDEKSKYAVSNHRVSQDAEKRQTIIEVDTQRQPLTAFELDTPDRNFSRHAVVEAQTVHGVHKTWRKIGEGTLTRVDFKNSKRDELSVSFPKSRHALYRMVIDNRDSPPLEVAGVKAEGPLYELVYLAAPNRAHRLTYGSEEAKRANYDTAAIAELLREGFQTARGELEPQGSGSAAGLPQPFRPSKLLDNPLVVGGIIALLVVALGWGLYQAVRRIDTLPK